MTILGRKRELRLELVTPGYFAAMETPVLRGNLPAAAASAGSEIPVVVNEAFERRYFPDGAIGRQIGFGARRVGTIAASSRI